MNVRGLHPNWGRRPRPHDSRSRWLLATGLLLAVLIGFTFSQPLGAQETSPRQVDTSGALMPREGAPALVQADAPTGPVNGRATTAEDVSEIATLDYVAWERMAKRAETAIGNRNTSSISLEHLRAQLVDWREAMLGAQNANAARIATLRTQISALGPAPIDGQTEVEGIATRRSALTEQLVQLQAPGISAEEAYRRADGLIREIDRVLRERQADQLLQLWPSPINPANWPEAVISITDTGVRLWDEVVENWANEKRRNALGDNLPLVLGFLGVSAGLLGFGRRWMGRLAGQLQDRASAHGRRIWALLVSLGEILIPAFGVTLIVLALTLTGMAGVIGTQIIETGLNITLPTIIASWLAARIFPRGKTPGPLDLPSERRAEARYNAVAMGLLLGVDEFRFAAMDSQSYSDGANSVSSFPGLVIAGLLLVRMGQLLHNHAARTALDPESQNYGRKLLGFLGQAAMAVGVIGPLLAAVGYIAAADAMIYPAILSLGLIGLILILQDLVTDIYAILMRKGGDASEALVPVLVNFALALLSLPIFALIWGARTADITELWSTFREGFSIGDTRISPSAFLIFAVIFAIGYTLTRMLQGALKTSILPRTGLDQGGQNATVSGIGYVGIFLAALIAINAAGIDLSGLAIVAGALSVGIGFGLQTIVSNFVSGIILLIERPVSEGDWIEVGTTQGIVKSISVRSTRIQTFDRSDVIVPNSDLITGRVTNWTRFNLTGRLIVPVSVPFTEDSRRIEVILQEIAELQPLVVMKPPPFVAFMGFGAEVMNFEMRMILRDVNFQLQVRSDINHLIAKRFREEGVVFSLLHGAIQRRAAEAEAFEAQALDAERQHEEAVEALLEPLQPSRRKRNKSAKATDQDPTDGSSRPPPKEFED